MILLLCQLFLDTISPYIKNICLQILTVFSFGGVFCTARQNQAVSFLYRIFPLPACLGLCPSALANSSHPSLLAGTSHRVFASSAHLKNFRQAAFKTPKSCRIRHHLILFCPWYSTLAFTKPCLGTTLCFDGKCSRALQDLVSSDIGTLFRVAFRSSVPICSGPCRNRSAVDAKLCSNRRKTFLQPFFLAAGDLYSDGGKAPHVVFERHLFAESPDL